MSLTQSKYYALIKNKKFPNEEKSNKQVSALRRKINKLNKNLSKERDDLKKYDIRKRLAEYKQELLTLSASSNEFLEFLNQKHNLQKKISTNIRDMSYSKRYDIPDSWTTEYIASSQFLDSFEWKSLRYDLLKHYERLNAKRCMVCNADNVILNVDHIKPRKFYPHLALDGKNLQILCHNCNHGKANTIHDHRRKFLSSL